MNRLLLVSALLLTGCTQQIRVKHWGGTAEENLPPGTKLVNATWEQENLWYVTRPMVPGDVATTYRIVESSSHGIFQGTIILHEVVQ